MLTLHLFLDPSHIHQHKYNSQDYEDHRYVPSQTSQHALSHCAPSNSVVTGTKTEEYIIFHYSEGLNPVPLQNSINMKRASVNKVFQNPHDIFQQKCISLPQPPNKANHILLIF